MRMHQEEWPNRIWPKKTADFIEDKITFSAVSEHRDPDCSGRSKGGMIMIMAE